MDITEQLSAEDLELRRLQDQIAEAKARQSTLLKAQADKAALAIIEAKQRAEAERDAKQQEHDRKVEEMLRKKAEAKKAEADAKAQAAAENARLEREAEALQEKLREKAKHEAAVKALQEKLFNEEQENLRIAAELQGKSTGPRVEPPPATLHDTTHPLGVLFGQDAAPAPAVRDLTAEQNAALQKEKDAQVEAQARATHQRTFPSHQQIYALQNAFLKHTSYNVNFDQLSEVLSFFADNVVMAKMLEMVPLWKARPVSASQMVVQLRDALENPAPTVDEDTKALKAYIDKMRLPWGVA